MSRRERESEREQLCVLWGQESILVNVFMWYSEDRRSVQLTQIVSWDKNEWKRNGMQRASKWEWERYRDEKSVGFQIQSLDISGAGRPWAGLTAICHLRLACQHTLTAAAMAHFLRQERQHEEAKVGGQHWKRRPKIKGWTLPGPGSYWYAVSNNTFLTRCHLSTDSNCIDILLCDLNEVKYKQKYNN